MADSEFNRLRAILELAARYGLPPEIAARLAGDTAADLETDAKSWAAQFNRPVEAGGIGPGAVAVPAGGQPRPPAPAYNPAAPPAPMIPPGPGYSKGLFNRPPVADQPPQKRFPWQQPGDVDIA